MILIGKTNDKRKMVEEAPFGPGFDPMLSQRAAVMEVFGSTAFDDIEGCRFVLRDSSGNLIGEREIRGY